MSTADKLNSNPTVQKVASHPVVQSTVNSVQRQLNVLGASPLLLEARRPDPSARSLARPADDDPPSPPAIRVHAPRRQGTQQELGRPRL